MEDSMNPRIIPRTVATCPICDASLWISEITAWTVEDDGTEIPDEVSIECEKAPSLDNPEWDAWLDGHYMTPYTDWLPVDNKVLGWLQKPEQKERWAAL